MDLEDLRVFDGGDVDLPFGGVAAALSLLEERAAVYLRDGKRPVMLGGEHLATLAPVRAALAVYPDLRVIQFDAHADLRDEYLGERYSHATVMRRVCELAGDGRVYQFGIRSGLRDEFDFAREHTVMRKYDFDGLRDTVRGLDGLPVYITIDLDVLDPSVLPGTGTPEPAGVTFRLLLDAISALESARIVGADIVELSPHYDLSGVSAVTACVALRELLLTIG
jgi:agmatinase